MANSSQKSTNSQEIPKHCCPCMPGTQVRSVTGQEQVCAHLQRAARCQERWFLQASFWWRKSQVTVAKCIWRRTSCILLSAYRWRICVLCSQVLLATLQGGLLLPTELPGLPEFIAGITHIIFWILGRTVDKVWCSVTVWESCGVSYYCYEYCAWSRSSPCQGQHY